MRVVQRAEAEIRYSELSFECSKVQSSMQSGIHFHLGTFPWLDSKDLHHEFLKNLGTFVFRGCGHSANLRGRYHPGNALKFHSGSLQGAGALVQRQGVTLNLVSVAPHQGRCCSALCLLVDETAHANVHHDSQRHEHEQQ